MSTEYTIIIQIGHRTQQGDARLVADCYVNGMVDMDVGIGGKVEPWDQILEPYALVGQGISVCLSNVVASFPSIDGRSRKVERSMKVGVRVC